MHLRTTFLLATLALLSGCTFSTVRSAEVYPGLSLSLQASTTTPPGEDVYWFSPGDCYECNKPVTALYTELTVGSVSPDGARGNEFSAGIDGVMPFVGAYRQLAKGERSAYGIGGRLGLPIVSWKSSQLYGRYDRLLAPGQRLLLNPALVLHWGNSPNGENPGHYVGFAQGVGMEFEGKNVSFIPAASVVLLRGDRTSYDQPEGPFTTAFATAFIAVVFHRKRSPAPAPVPVPAQPGEP